MPVLNESTICSPPDLLGDAPCLRCLSPSQQQIALAIVWATMAGYTLPRDLDKLLADIACIDCNITSESKRVRAELTVMAPLAFGEQLTVSIPDEFACMPCLTPSQVQSIILLSKCIYWKAHTLPT